MNKSKIEWCDHTWNPITGCRHNCSYCYARRMTARFAGDVRLNLMAKKDYSIEPAADNSDNVFVLEEPMLNETGNTLVYPFGFEPTYHKYRMDYPEKLKMGNNIFVGAMADIFGKWVPDEWIRDVMETCLDNPIHNYLFLTKNPERYTEVGVPAGLENMWYGTTITCDADADRFNYLPAGCNTFVSIEPLMEDIVSKHNVMFRQVDWIIIGAETGRNKNKIVDKYVDHVEHAGTFTVVGISADEKWYKLKSGLFITTIPEYVSFKATPEQKQQTAGTGYYRVRKNWDDAGSQIGAFKNQNNAIELCKQNSGYKVFDNDGNEIYPCIKDDGTPFKFRVTIPDLRIRKGPGTTYDYWKKNGSPEYTGKNVFTIIDTAEGPGAKIWGLLKSGEKDRDRWISLDEDYGNRL